MAVPDVRPVRTKATKPLHTIDGPKIKSCRTVRWVMARFAAPYRANGERPFGCAIFRSRLARTAIWLSEPCQSKMRPQRKGAQLQTHAQRTVVQRINRGATQQPELTDAHINRAAHVRSISTLQRVTCEQLTRVLVELNPCSTERRGQLRPSQPAHRHVSAGARREIDQRIGHRWLRSTYRTVAPSSRETEALGQRQSHCDSAGKSRVPPTVVCTVGESETDQKAHTGRRRRMG